MTNRVAMFFGVAALAAQFYVLPGCGSSGGASGTGGSTGAGGTGTGGVSGGGGAGGGTAPAAKIGELCPSTVKNKGLCTTEPPCWNTCGPNKSGFKNCTCSAGAWACPTCSYDPAGDYSCYRITAATVACPRDTSDPLNGLPASGSACTPDPATICKICGSGSNVAYRDSTGVNKVGWCICLASPSDPTVGVYSCASVSEWPML